MKARNLILGLIILIALGVGYILLRKLYATHNVPSPSLPAVTTSVHGSPANAEEEVDNVGKPLSQGTVVRPVLSVDSPVNAFLIGDIRKNFFANQDKDEFLIPLYSAHDRRDDEIVIANLDLIIDILKNEQTHHAAKLGLLSLAMSAINKNTHAERFQNQLASLGTLLFNEYYAFDYSTAIAFLIGRIQDKSLPAEERTYAYLTKNGWEMTQSDYDFAARHAQ